MKYIIDIFILLQLLPSADIFYSADRVIYNNKTEIIELIGNAVLREGINRMQAVKIFYNKKNKTAEGFKKVVLINTRDQAKISGDYIFYDSSNRFARMDNRPVLYSEKDSLSVCGDVMYRYFDSNTSGAYSNVYIRHDDGTNITEGFGDTGIFFESKSYARLNNHCRILRTNLAAAGDYTELFLDRKNIIMSGDAVISNFEKDNTNIIQALYVLYDYAENRRHFYCYTNVSILNIKEDLETKSAYAFCNTETGYTWLSGKPVMNNRRENIVTASESMERFGRENVLYAKGNVTVTGTDKNAFSDFAVYHGDDKKIILSGNPGVSRDNNTFLAETIEMDIASGRTVFYNQITGALFP
ncbi:MAG: hypothetical protein A2096_16240 [Spirochaetes bacterium GWF1_41_5]|nr:MAG: hypothetical protein A2096_16240 [Spirochaetes bacterium GWF1_41_5]HBE01385.1 hypothetical protein [Spirochaetia bacterium]